MIKKSKRKKLKMKMLEMEGKHQEKIRYAIKEDIENGGILVNQEILLF